MQIKIGGNTSSKERISVTLDDYQMDDDNFIELIIRNECVTVALDDLFPALIAFDAKRSRRLSNEESLEE